MPDDVRKKHLKIKEIIIVMAESMKGLKRSHRCTEVSRADMGREVTVMGWVQKSRNKGSIIFVDLRDRSGLLQIIFEEGKISDEYFEKAAKLRSEFVIAVVGNVEERAGGVNKNMATGDIEIRARQLRVLSESLTPPFPVEEGIKTKEELRLKYRYLDLRRPDLQKNIILRSRIAVLIRQFLADEGFWRLRRRSFKRARQKAPEITLCQAVSIRASFMRCLSHRSCLSSF